MLPRSCADKPSRDCSAGPLVFDLRSEWYRPTLAVLCVLSRHGERVAAQVNTAYGLRGYLHAAYHTEHWHGEASLVCQPDNLCGYDDLSET